MNTIDGNLSITKDYFDIQDIIQNHCDIFLKGKNIQIPNLNSISNVFVYSLYNASIRCLS